MPTSLLEPFLCFELCFLTCLFPCFVVIARVFFSALFELRRTSCFLLFPLLRDEHRSRLTMERTKRPASFRSRVCIGSLRVDLPRSPGPLFGSIIVKINCRGTFKPGSSVVFLSRSGSHLKTRSRQGGGKLHSDRIQVHVK